MSGKGKQHQVGGLRNRPSPGTVLALVCLCLPLLAQEPPMPPGAPPTSNASGTVPPLPQPPLRCPLDFFRDLLSMTPAARERALTNRTPEARKLILAKARDYEALSPDQRALRLKVTELRGWLWPLMQTAATNRGERLSLIPVEERLWIEERLRQWDQLAPDRQRDLLEHEPTLRRLTEVLATPPAQQNRLMTNLPAAGRDEWEKGMARWQQLPIDRRAEVAADFSRFFDLNPREQRRTLGRVPESERRQIEKTIRTFEALPQAERTRCLRSLQKFTQFTPEQRERFLSSAERWGSMTPSERQVWRDLVHKLAFRPPPLPEDATPPLPSAGLPRRPAVATANGE